MLPMHTGQQELRGVRRFLSFLSAGFLETLLLSRQPRPPHQEATDLDVVEGVFVGDVIEQQQGWIQKVMRTSLGPSGSLNHPHTLVIASHGMLTPCPHARLPVEEHWPHVLP